ncbi:hypothetical protein [Shewanella algae]|uniref:Lipoprotein n=1 Tax=Shewanella algae TaxID=38313 RepID=A0A380BUL2_9GAMM|nr:hypothetical protein [Shewanella algae]MBO2607741.1 hypothetical protein [Shewanella algae]SUJ06976.1 Uncharacterised protein [Shewanella algae]
MHSATLPKLFGAVFSLLLLLGCDQAQTPQATQTVADPGLCDFSVADCVKKLGEQQISLMLNPSFAPSEKPIHWQLGFNRPVSNLKLRVEGRDMFMGVIPMTPSATEGEAFEGQLIFGSCSSGYMVWRVFVSWQQGTEQYSTWFDFLADSHKQK